MPTLSDADVDRIALRVRSLVVPEVQSVIDKSVGNLKTEHDKRIKGLNTDITELQTRVHQLEEENDDLRSDLAAMRHDIDDMKWCDDELEQYSRKNSLRISCESELRATDNIVLDIANEYNIEAEL